MNKQFNSVYADHIKEFISLKRRLGFKYKVGEWHMRNIDSLAVESSETTPGITKEFAERIRAKRPNESHRFRYDRVRHLANFSSYLLDNGIESYQPHLLKYKSNDFVPFIFSHDEILRIFNAADKLLLNKKANSSSYLFCFPAIIRLLYATGLRVGEAVALINEDVNTKENYVKVRDSKNGRERIIPISETLSKILEDYSHYKGRLLLSERRKQSFFVSPNGEQCSTQSVSYYFKKCFDSGIRSDTFNTSTPRVHDLRHTFAVRSLAQMAEAGVDLYASLPILMTYLGHSSISATEHYVRLTSSIYPELIKDVDKFCINVFPKSI